jgi:peptidoglycan hydrolase-like protein with peptidoglycan-binding domain
VVVIALVVIVLGAGATAVDRTKPYGVDFDHPMGLRAHAASGAGNATATSTATVTRQSLSAQTSVNGTIGYRGDYTVLGQLRGTITKLPSVGQIIRQGQELYEVDGGRPAILLYGSTPAYRNLAAGTYASDVTGPDVLELNAALVALGYASRDDLDPTSDEFSWATTAAIKKLQQHFGLTQTGKLDLGQVVFLPTAARVTSVAGSLGSQAGGPILKASSTSRQVSVAIDAAQQSQVKVGDRVTITLPDNETTPGRVTSVGKVAKTAGDSTTVDVTIAPTHPDATGSLDQGPVQVAITSDTARNALVVPVNALLALAGGGYAVEVIAADGKHRLVPVTTGLFDDSAGLVQVTDTDLIVGQRVVVPST